MKVGAASPGVFSPLLARDIALLWSHPAGKWQVEKMMKIDEDDKDDEDGKDDEDDDEDNEGDEID